MNFNQMKMTTREICLKFVTAVLSFNKKYITPDKIFLSSQIQMRDSDT